MKINFISNWAALFNNYLNISNKQTSFFSKTNFFVYIVYKILLE